MTSKQTEGTPAAQQALQAIQDRDRYKALGRAVSYLMTKPAFAKLPFGHWSRILTGQINRGHYLFVVRGDMVVGFLGWALTTEDKADPWLAGTRELSAEDSLAGDCVLVNAWEASSGEVHQFIVGCLRQIGQGKRLVYGKRFYDDGRVRDLKMPVSRFVANHLRAARSAGSGNASPPSPNGRADGAALREGP